MVTQDIVLTPVSLPELFRQFREIIREEIKAEYKQQVYDQLLSVGEACKLFKPPVSRQTLSTWTKAGNIPMQKIGGCNFYKYSDVIEAGTKLKRYKKP